MRCSVDVVCRRRSVERDRREGREARGGSVATPDALEQLETPESFESDESLLVLTRHGTLAERRIRAICAALVADEFSTGMFLNVSSDEEDALTLLSNSFTSSKKREESAEQERFLRFKLTEALVANGSGVVLGASLRSNVSDGLLADLSAISPSKGGFGCLSIWKSVTGDMGVYPSSREDWSTPTSLGSITK